LFKYEKGKRWEAEDTMRRQRSHMRIVYLLFAVCSAFVGATEQARAACPNLTGEWVVWLTEPYFDGSLNQGQPKVCDEIGMRLESGGDQPQLLMIDNVFRNEVPNAACKVHFSFLDTPVGNCSLGARYSNGALVIEVRVRQQGTGSYFLKVTTIERAPEREGIQVTDALFLTDKDYEPEAATLLKSMTNVLSGTATPRAGT
jgi:hypothetical protein